jgi:lysozyme family protein
MDLQLSFNYLQYVLHLFRLLLKPKRAKTMAVPSQLKTEYEDLYKNCQIRSEQLGSIDSIIDKITSNKKQYKIAESSTKVPWYVIATIHNLESSLSFTTHLHNGDPLSARTVQVPAGRPLSNPPFTWSESAIDALEYDGLSDWSDWSIAGIAYKLEGYNGMGFRQFHPEVKSPYLWSFCNHYVKGKYASDGKFDPDLVSAQCGGMVLLKRMEERDLIDLSDDEIDPMPIVTWLELYRKEQSGTAYPVIVANAGSTPVEIVELKDRSTQDFIDFISKHPTAKTFLVAPATKPIPSAVSPGIIVIPPSGVALPSLTRILRWGVIGDDVKSLQKALNALGFNAGDVDGEFEDKTEKAVKAFQLKYGMLVDGEVGPLTWEKLGGTAGVITDNDPLVHSRLATFAANEAAKQLSWSGAGSEAEKYLEPFREPMRKLGHIGNDKVFYDWCGAFVTYCCRQVGVTIPDQPSGFWATMALVESWQYWAKQQGYWHPKGSTKPQRGDIVTFDWNPNTGGSFNHIGIVRGYQGGSMIETAEGNKSNQSGNFTRSLSFVSGIVRIR